MNVNAWLALSNFLLVTTVGLSYYFGKDRTKIDNLVEQISEIKKDISSIREIMIRHLEKN